MVERRTEQEISVKEPHSRRLQAKDRSDPAFLDNRSLIPAETALSSLLDHMHVTRTSYTSVQGKDLPRRFQTQEDEFVGMFVARGAIELRTADGPWMTGGKGIGRAQVWTPVTNAYLVCSLQPDKNKSSPSTQQSVVRIKTAAISL